MAWTTLEEEETRLDALAASARVEVDTIGSSAGGRPLRLVRIGISPPAATQRAVILHVGAQHGDEPAGREALLDWAEYLEATVDADEVDFLTNYGVLIIPTVNPDGIAADTRRNGHNVDINRRHLTLTEPEASAVGAVVGQARPLVLIDHHEASPQLSANVTFLGGTNPAVDSGIFSRSNVIIQRLKDRMTTDGWTVGDYNGLASEQILRSAAGFRHTAGVLVETSRSQTDQDRIDQQYACAEEAMAYVMVNTSDLLDGATAAEERKAAEGAAGAAFDLRVTVLDPAPLGYRLSAAQLSATALHRQAFNIILSGNVVSMAQLAQPAIPHLFDARAEFNVVSANTTDDVPEPSPPGGLPEVGVAQIRTRMVWLGCDLVSGRVIAELHDIAGPVSRLIGTYTQAQLTLPIPLNTTGRAPLATVLQATQPAEVMIVAVVNDLPIWAGIPLPRERGTEATMPLGCITLEGYLDRRYVGDHDLEDVDEALIAAALVGDAQVEGIGLTLDTPLTGRPRTKHYRSYDDATVYQRLQELSKLEAGPEWTVDLDWTDGDENVVRKVFRLRPRLGAAADAPNAVFRTTASSVFGSQSGSEARYRFREDYTDGRYANHILPVGSGEGEDRAQGSPARDEDALGAGKARWEMRIRPSTSITDVDELTDYGQAELGRRKHGAQTWRITARWSAYPRYGVDWRLGDDLAWQLEGHGHPDPGVSGQGRGIGFELDPQAGTLAPILLDPTSNGG